MSANFLPPALASSSGSPVTAEGWVFERKLDGLRCLAVRNGDDVQLWSRNERSFTARFPTVVGALARLSADVFVLDGELVLFTVDGATSFSLLQQGGGAPVFVVFDLLYLLGHDVRELPLEERVSLLRETVAEGNVLRVADQLDGDPAALLAGACMNGWEGLVAKQRGSRYPAGRSPAWRKLKCTASQELVIGGWTDPRGSRAGIGALLVGYHDGDGVLRYAGKVGTGFTAETLRDLERRLLTLEQPASPFLERAEKGAHWARPELVADVAFAEWTRDGRLRHPSFQGLRFDKSAHEVVRESLRSVPRA